MNLSFSTRGWQSLGWDEIIEIADEMRFSGIELYNIHKRPEFYEKGCPLHKYSTSATARSLREKGIKIRVPLKNDSELSGSEVIHLYALREKESRRPASRTGQVTGSYRQRREIYGHCPQAPCL